MPIFKMKLGTPFLRLFLSSIIFTVYITCIQAKDQSKNKAYRGLGYRLSKDVLPRHYNIKIVFPGTLDHFRGECEIDIEIFKATSNIRIHSPDTIGEKVIILFMKNKEYESIPIVRKISGEHSIQENILDLFFKQQLFPGNYTLSISYVTYIEDIGEGYFKIVFQPEERNQQNLLLATNIQSIEARKWFPCWDEPEFKATFLISFNHERKHKIWPIMSAENYTSDDYDRSWMWTNFVIPYPISTYQVMFTLTDLNLRSSCVCTSHPTTEFYKVNVFNTIWRRPGLDNSMKFSDVVFKKILQSAWYKKMPVTVTDINQLAIPDMQEDVIGKWRLILYKESLVTYDEETGNSAQKREIAHVITRAIIHQVIDNTITPSWWSHLWLNEGLAALLHMDTLEQIFPEWRFLDLFVVQVQQDCFRHDTMFTMRPLSHEVQTSSEIKSLFSFPIYVKAPVILRMVRHIMGNTFQEIIEKFLNKYFLKTSKPDDLWNMMQVNVHNLEHTTPTMKDIMETWVTRNNYPIVYVHRYKSLLSISQSRNESYIINANDDKGNVQVSRHWLPITFTTWEQLDFSNTTPHNWITPEENSKISVPLNNSDEWIIVNLQQTGYYRVKYDDWSLYSISVYLYSENYEKIHVLNRAQIIDDTYYFLMRGEVTYNMFVYLIFYLRQERDYVTWYPMFQIFRDISHFLPLNLTRSDAVMDAMRYILQGLLGHLTYNETIGEDDLTKWLRQEAVRWACIFGDTDCQRIANARLEEHLKDPTNHKLSPEWREWTYCKGAMIANESLLLKLIELSYTNESKIYNYISYCAEKYDLAMDIFFNSSLSKKHSGSKLFPYFMFVDYAVRNTGLRVKRYFDTHNVSDSDKVKLLCIIINRSFSENTLDEISRIKNYYFTDSEIGENLHDVVERRLSQIEYLKERLKLLNWH